MSLKAGFLFIALLVGSNAFPVEDDMSIFFDHTDSSARIIGGDTAGLVPYMVALTTGLSVRNLVCGGSLVTSRHIMSAAHCVRSMVSDGQVISTARGIVNSNRYVSGGNMYVFSKYIMHPNYNHAQIKNDIGFLITSTNVALSNTVSLVALSFDFAGAGVPTTVTGWGLTATGGSFSQDLLQLSGTVIDGDRCVILVGQRGPLIGMWYLPPVDPKVELCSYNSPTAGVCNGDSGSPLMRSDRNQQIGIVSWGIPCARDAPDMFARLSVFRDFVEESLRVV